MVNQMKKNEYIYLANAMWVYADKHDGKISSLLRELVMIVNENVFTKEVKEVKINENKKHNKTRQKWINRNEGVGIDDMGEYEQNATSDRPNDTDSTSDEDF